MTEQLDSALRDLADEARNYSNPDGVIAEARRRRGRAAFLSTLAVVLIVIVGAGMVRLFTPSVADRSLPASPTDYPTQISAPTASTPPLPRTAVGRGFLVLRCPGCPPSLITTDGKQYTLPDDDGTGPAALSPDGRWLQVQIDGASVLRDLTSERTVSLNGTSAWRWSSDGLRLVVQSGQGWALLDPNTGASTSINTGEQYWLPLGAVSAAEVIVGPQRGDGNYATQGARETVRVVDPSSGKTLRVLNLDASSLLKTNESIMGWMGLQNVQIFLSKDYIAIPLAGRGTGAILFSLADGKALRRINFPADAGVEDDRWSVVGFGEIGLFGVRNRPQGSAEIVLAESAEGIHRIITVIPPSSMIYSLAVQDE